MPGPINPGTRLAVALDVSDLSQAQSLFRKLRDFEVIYKIGPHLLFSGGFELISEIKKSGAEVFIDLKLYDIPNTVLKTVEQYIRLEIDYFTLHLSGGREMIESVRSRIDSDSGWKPKVLGVSVLTSFSAESWSLASGTIEEIGSAAERMVNHGVRWGVDGVVCSAHELDGLKRRHPELYTVVPGIRPAGYSAQDQKRVLTPAEAAEKGASMIVVGRPITESDVPERVVAQILNELGERSA